MIDRDSRLRPRSPSACTAQLWLELWSSSAYGRLLLRVLGSGYLRSRLYRVELEQGFCSIAHVGIFNSAQIRFWLSKWVPHLILATINL